MRTASTVYGVGEIDAAPTEAGLSILPRRWKRDGSKPLLCYLHGAGQTALSATLNLATGSGQWRFIHGLVLLTGCPLYAHDAGGLVWGSATHDARIADMVDLGRSDLGASSDPVVLVGGSMGHLGAVNYAKQNPAEVAAVIGLIPVCDLDDMYQNNRGGWRASIGAAWGVTYPTPLPATANPTTDPGDIDEVPVLDLYGELDTTIPPSTVTTFNALCGAGSEARSLGSVGHDDSAFETAAAAHLDHVVQWLRAIGAIT